jgi:hypothetical protein
VANLVIASNSKAMSKLDGSVKNKVYDFFEKLSGDDTAPGLHIEPLNAAIDSRVRTGRVDLHYRAILFRVDDKSSGPTYIYMGTWPHDEANKLAERATLRVNPINGTLEGLIGEVPAPTQGKMMTTSKTSVTDVFDVARGTPFGHGQLTSLRVQLTAELPPCQCHRLSEGLSTTHGR